MRMQKTMFLTVFRAHDKGATNQTKLCASGAKPMKCAPNLADIKAKKNKMEKYPHKH